MKGFGDSLKVGSEYVFIVLVKQQFVDAITWLVLLIVSFVLITHCIRVLPKLGWNGGCYNIHGWRDSGGKEAYDKQKWSDKTTIYFMMTIFSMIFLATCLFHTDTIVTGFMNPEYGAMKEVMDLIK